MIGHQIDAPMERNWLKVAVAIDTTQTATNNDEQPRQPAVEQLAVLWRHPESSKVNACGSTSHRVVGETWPPFICDAGPVTGIAGTDRKSTRLNSSHGYISYAVFCLK